jgi:hypothetical protein
MNILQTVIEDKTAANTQHKTIESFFLLVRDNSSNHITRLNLYKPKIISIYTRMATISCMEQEFYVHEKYKSTIYIMTYHHQNICTLYLCQQNYNASSILAVRRNFQPHNNALDFQ